MRAGRLRHKVDIEYVSETQNATTGEIVQSWKPFCHVWAAIEPMSVREFVAAQAVQSQITTMIIIRYKAGVTAKMRIYHGETIYNIEGVLPDKKTGREYLTLACSTGANDG